MESLAQIYRATPEPRTIAGVLATGFQAIGFTAFPCQVPRAQGVQLRVIFGGCIVCQYTGILPVFTPPTGPTAIYQPICCSGCLKLTNSLNGIVTFTGTILHPGTIFNARAGEMFNIQSRASGLEFSSLYLLDQGKIVMPPPTSLVQRTPKTRATRAIAPYPTPRPVAAVENLVCDVTEEQDEIVRLRRQITEKDDEIAAKERTIERLIGDGARLTEEKNSAIAKISEEKNHTIIELRAQVASLNARIKRIADREKTQAKLAEDDAAKRIGALVDAYNERLEECNATIETLRGANAMTNAALVDADREIHQLKKQLERKDRRVTPPARYCE